MINWSTIGKVACGFALGTAGVKLLSSKDAKKCYTHITAAAYRCKDTCLETYTNIKENCQDISADAKENADCSKFMVHSRFKAIDNIIIHDAARPFVSVENIDECITALDSHEGAMPVLPMKDTVYFSRTGKHVDELLNRSCIYAGQAPEAFRFDKYMEANEALLPDKILMINGSTEPAIMAGLDVAMIPGDQRNFKVTTDEDLARAREILG